jgi:ubiquinone/menaquinone biosynthesis C-methylase UbiE
MCTRDGFFTHLGVKRLIFVLIDNMKRGVIMSLFDKQADSYDAWYDTPMGRFIDEVETQLAFSLFKPEPGMKVLDVGCGTGNFSVKLAQQGCQVTGIDISAAMLKIAREKARHNPELGMEFTVMDFNQLDFENETFDAVFSMTAFEFAKDPAHGYEEMLRVLKPGGLLLIGVIGKDGDWGQYYLQKAKSDPDSVFNFFNLQSLEQMEALDQNNLVASGECLFVPHDFEASRMNWEEEKRLSQSEKGSFLCVLFKKPS